jgi:hypothetical protein
VPEKRSSGGSEKGAESQQNVFRKQPSGASSAMRQVIVLLTCWLKNANLLPTGLRKNMFATHSARDFFEKGNCFLILQVCLVQQ